MLKTEAVCKSYKGRRVLKDISFALNSGEVLGIVGESGCGKSTLARLICGYEKPDSGTIFFQRKDCGNFTRKEKADFHRKCQLIFQDNLASFDPMLKMGASLREALRYNFSMDREEQERKISSFLEITGLQPEMLNRLPASLSGGERQRMNICRALLLEPEFLVCDEITSSLDVLIQVSLLRLLRELNQKSGMTILFISHDINAVKAVSDRILIMEDGRLVEEMKRSEGFAHHSDHSRKLFHALPASHPRERKRGRNAK